MTSQKEPSLDNLVSGNHLEHSGFKKKHGVMYRIIHDQEIRFIEVRDNLYAWAGIHYVGRPIERYEEVME